MIRLNTGFHAFVANDQLAAEIENEQNGTNAILVSISVRFEGGSKHINVALVREDEPQTQLNNAENLLHI